jgi:hypothetical protein
VVLDLEVSMRIGVMRAVFRAAALSATLLAAPVASAAAYDLDQPGALESLKQARPEHHAKVQRIIADALRLPDEGVPSWLQTAYGAQDVRFEPLLLTSDPPQRQLSFTLDQTAYKAVLRLTDAKPRALPARE